MVAVVAGSAFLGMACSGTAEASTLYPGVGKKPSAAWRGNIPKAKPPQTTAATSNKTTEASKPASSWRGNSSQDGVVTVGLAEGIVKASVSSIHGFHVLGQDGRDYGSFRPTIVANIEVAGGQLIVNGKNSGASVLVISPVATADGQRIRFNSTSYRGQLIIRNQNGKLQVVNQVRVDDYLKGVLPSEMSPSWNIEALKAQAVAARTFAFYAKTKGQHSGDGYMLCSSTHCQVYEGMGHEAQSASKAVEATSGEIMQYKGAPIYAPYHASSGGSTASCEEVWGNDLPYLRSVKDDDSLSPHHDWSVEFSGAQIENKLNAASKGIGALKSIAMVPVEGSKSPNGVHASGRVNGVQFAGSEGTVVLDAQKVRQIFGLKSTYFTVRTERQAMLPNKQHPAKPKLKHSKGNIDAAPAAMSGTDMKIAGGMKIFFDGHGFGHGLGMSQYGAKAMADAGRSYDAILNHYYTNIDIVKVY